MNRHAAKTACAGALALGVLAFAGLTDTAVAQQSAAGRALQEAVDRTCVIEIRSSNGQRLELQNLCLNPRAVRITWGDGRIYDYCLNSSGDVRYVVKLTSNYRMIREQDILICQ